MRRIIRFRIEIIETSSNDDRLLLLNLQSKRMNELSVGARSN